MPENEPIRFGLMGYGKNYKVDVRNFDRFAKEGITLDELKEVVGKENIKNMPLFEKMFASIAKDNLLDANELLGYFKQLDKAAELKEENLMLSDNELLRSTGEELGDILQANELEHMEKVRGHVGKKTNDAQTETMFQFVTALIKKNDEKLNIEDRIKADQDALDAEIAAAKDEMDNAKAEAERARVAANKAKRNFQEKDKQYKEKKKAERDLNEKSPIDCYRDYDKSKRELLEIAQNEVELAKEELQKAQKIAERKNSNANEKEIIANDKEVEYKKKVDLKNRTSYDYSTGNKTVVIQEGYSETFNLDNEKLYETNYDYMRFDVVRHYTQLGNNEILYETWEDTSPIGAIIHKVFLRTGEIKQDETDEMPVKPQN